MNCARAVDACALRLVLSVEHGRVVRVDEEPPTPVPPTAAAYRAANPPPSSTAPRQMVVASLQGRVLARVIELAAPRAPVAPSTARAAWYLVRPQHFGIASGVAEAGNGVVIDPYTGDCLSALEAALYGDLPERGAAVVSAAVERLRGGDLREIPRVAEYVRREVFRKFVPTQVAAVRGDRDARVRPRIVSPISPEDTGTPR